MATDRKYRHGGANTVDGNYETDKTIGSRALRLYCAKRARWPGGRGRVIGSRLMTLEKMDEETVNEIPGMVEEAWDPLTATREMSDVIVTPEVVGNMDGAVEVNADFTDRTTGGNIPLKLPSGWSS